MGRPAVLIGARRPMSRGGALTCEHVCAGGRLCRVASLRVARVRITDFATVRVRQNARSSCSCHHGRFLSSVRCTAARVRLLELLFTPSTTIADEEEKEDQQDEKQDKEAQHGNDRDGLEKVDRLSPRLSVAQPGSPSAGSHLRCLIHFADSHRLPGHHCVTSLLLPKTKMPPLLSWRWRQTLMTLMREQTKEVMSLRGNCQCEPMRKLSEQCLTKSCKRRLVNLAAVQRVAVWHNDEIVRMCGCRAQRQ